MRKRSVLALILVGVVALITAGATYAAQCSSWCTGNRCDQACNNSGHGFCVPPVGVICNGGAGYCAFECSDGVTIYVPCEYSCGGGGGGSPVFAKHPTNP